MDSKGLANIEILFCTAIIIIILLINMPFLEKSIDASNEIDDNSKARSLLNHIANSVNQVNSKGYGFNQKIQMPQSINGKYYSVLVNTNEIILEFNNKKGKSSIVPINLVDSNNHSINGVQLYNGREHRIKKVLINDNQTHRINQSSILIQPL